jgi:large subunit ribosomal protein L6
MSRVGKRPVKILQGVKVSYQAPFLEVSGKGGKLKREIPSCVSIDVKGEEIKLSVASMDPQTKAIYGLSRTLVQNMVTGVTQGYQKVLELKGVGYRAQTSGSILTLTLGFSHPVNFELPTGVTAKVEANTKITLESADKELLGTTVARVRKIRPPECYKGKGIRYLGEHVVIKQGKAAGVAGAAGGAGGG